jgi:ABC-type transporter Mla MlaB component
MSDDKWDKVDTIMRKQEGAAVTKTGGTDNPLAPINQQIETIRKKELDLIGRFKRNQIERREALKALQAMHNAQFEAATHALKRAVDVERERVDTVANKYIFHITEEYLRNMRELGLQNFESRMETLMQLNETLKNLLEKAQTQDVPSTIRDATVENILKKYREFADKLMQEEIKLSK